MTKPNQIAGTIRIINIKTGIIEQRSITKKFEDVCKTGILDCSIRDLICKSMTFTAKFRSKDYSLKKVIGDGKFQDLDDGNSRDKILRGLQMLNQLDMQVSSGELLVGVACMQSNGFQIYNIEYETHNQAVKPKKNGKGKIYLGTNEAVNDMVEGLALLSASINSNLTVSVIL